MKAIVYHEYGSPNVLRCEEIEKPAPKDDEVLIKVRAASVNPLDCGELKGVPLIFRFLFGLRGPSIEKPARPGVDVAGIVEAIGKRVPEFNPGDAVFGLCLSNPGATGLKVWVHRQGSFAEYACVPASALVRKPETVTFEQAASVPVAALTALQGLRDKGAVQAGQKVLIHGAGGGVGTFAVQIARSFGAEVTGVTSTKNLGTVRSIGAHRVVDYTVEDFTLGGQRYDVIFDCHASRPLSACRRVLKPQGVYVAAGGPVDGGGLGLLTRLIEMFVVSRFRSQKLVTFLARPRRQDLNILRDLMERREIIPVVDARYTLSQVPEAIRFLQGGMARGKVVITVGN